VISTGYTCGGAIPQVLHSIQKSLGITNFDLNGFTFVGKVHPLNWKRLFLFGLKGEKKNSKKRARRGGGWFPNVFLRILQRLTFTWALTSLWRALWFEFVFFLLVQEQE